MEKKIWNGKFEKDTLMEASAGVMGFKKEADGSGRPVEEALDSGADKILMWSKKDRKLVWILESDWNGKIGTIKGTDRPMDEDGWNVSMSDLVPANVKWSEGMMYDLDEDEEAGYPMDVVQYRKKKADFVQKMMDGHYSKEIETINRQMADGHFKSEAGQPDYAVSKAKAELADLERMEKESPEIVTLDRYLHIAEILHVAGMYEEEAQLLDKARSKLSLKDPEYSKKLDYIKRQQSWNARAMKTHVTKNTEACKKEDKNTEMPEGDGIEANIDPRDKIISEIASYTFQKMKEISYKDPRQKSGYNGSITISHPMYTSPEYMWDIKKRQSYGEEEDRSNEITISFYSEIIYTGPSYADPKLAYQNTSATMYRRRKAKDYGIFDIGTISIEKIQKWIDKNIKKIITLKSGSYKK